MISSEDIKKILIEWQERKLPQIIERDLKVNLYPTEIVTLTGVRRAGKTFLLYFIIKELLKRFSKDQILYLNFEHELMPVIDAKEIRKFFQVHAELFKGKIKFVLFDEIQRVNNWELLLRRLYDEKRYFIFVTGSSSELRPKQIASSLRGRTINYTVFPLAFCEFLRFKNYKFNEKKILLETYKGEFLKLLREFVLFGGFPDVVIKDSTFEKRKLIFFYFDIILFRDIIEKYEVRNSKLLENFRNNLF